VRGGGDELDLIDSSSTSGTLLGTPLTAGQHLCSRHSSHAAGTAPSGRRRGSPRLKGLLASERRYEYDQSCCSVSALTRLRA
jgi:hypothetical protein